MKACHYFRLLLVLFGIVCCDTRLNDFISHFEGLDYDTNHLHQLHSRAKRSISADAVVSLRFDAHGREFHLRLRRDTSAFASDVKAVQPDGSLSEHDVSFIYSGEVVGEPGSRVHGSIISGIFAGTITVNSTHRYHVDKTELYFREPQSFHSVIFSEKDVDTKHSRFKRSAGFGGCANEESEVHKWMKTVQDSAVEKPVVRAQQSQQHRGGEGEGRPHHKYSREVNEDGERGRDKRAASTTPTLQARTCTLYLQSDPMLWDYVTKPLSQGGLGYDTARAKDEITSLFAAHVTGANVIYGDTIFQGKSDQGNQVSYTGFALAIRRVLINQTSVVCPQGANTRNNPFCTPNIDVSNFLNLNSLQNMDDFCTGFVFTYRDFTGGTLGLAWVAAPAASGGICERYKAYTESDGTVYKSLNTGIVTLLNYGSRMPVMISTLTFSHEVGHNFGSPHDTGSLCAPFTNIPPDPKGNFLMFPSATSGEQKNNGKFSPCSVGNITMVIDVIINQRNGKVNCFVESNAPFCGNNIVEAGEQCDCGYECANDPCCYGRLDTTGTRCQLKPNAACSPSQGPCCYGNCTVVPSAAKQVCQGEGQCNLQQTCNGLNATCPSPPPKANLTACNGQTQVCLGGMCMGSICQKIGNGSWKQCYQSAPANDPGYDMSQLCYVACESITSSGTGQCVSTSDSNALKQPANADLYNYLKSINQTSIQLPPGAPCNNFRGFCDVFQICRDVDADGPLARLVDFLLNQQTLNDVVSWITLYWWAVLLMGVGFVVLMAAFIKVCAVHTPSTNPNKPPARALTLRRQNRQPASAPGPSQSRSGPPPHGKGKGRGQKQRTNGTTRDRREQYELYSPHSNPV